jgi:hypothetical protein
MREWRWPRAGKIKFSHLQFETTVHDWQGAQITLICFDELLASLGSSRPRSLRGLRQHTWLWPWRRRPKGLIPRASVTAPETMHMHVSAEEREPD